MDASSAPSAATSNQHWRILLVENDALALAKFGSKRGFFDDDVFFKLIDEKEYLAAANWLSAFAQSHNMQYNELYGGLLDNALFSASSKPLDRGVNIDPHLNQLFQAHSMKKKHLANLPQDGVQQVRDNWQLVMNGARPEFVLNPPMPISDLKRLCSEISVPSMTAARAKAREAAKLPTAAEVQADAERTIEALRAQIEEHKSAEEAQNESKRTIEALRAQIEKEHKSAEDAQNESKRTIDELRAQVEKERKSAEEAQNESKRTIDELSAQVEELKAELQNQSKQEASTTKASDAAKRKLDDSNGMPPTNDQSIDHTMADDSVADASSASATPAAKAPRTASSAGRSAPPSAALSSSSVPQAVIPPPAAEPQPPPKISPAICGQTGDALLPLKPTARKGKQIDLRAGGHRSSPPGVLGTFPCLAPLLHAGGTLRKGMILEREDAQVQQLIVFAQMETIKSSEGGDNTARVVPWEILLVLHRDGMLQVFGRKKPSNVIHNDEDREPSRNLEYLGQPGDAPLLPAMDRDGAFLPLGTRLSANHMVVCVAGQLNLYPSSFENLRTNNGLRELVESKDRIRSQCREFGQRMPSEVSGDNGLVQCFAHHPLDQFLYAIALSDGRLIIKHMHIEDLYQTLGDEEALGSQTRAKETADAAPPALVFFSGTGHKLIWCKSTLTPQKTYKCLMRTFIIPNSILSPEKMYYDCEPEGPKREDFPSTQEGVKEFKKAKSEQRRAKQEATEKWRQDHIDAMRGDDLISSNSHSCDILDAGHPLAAVPRPHSAKERVERLKRETIKERAVLLWDKSAQLWVINGAAVEEEKSWNHAAGGLTCVVHLDWPPCNLTGEPSEAPATPSEEGACRYWLIGTKDNKVHILNSDGAEAMKHVGTADLAMVAPSADESVNESLPGITSIAVVHPGVFDRTERQPPHTNHKSLLIHSLLCAGFSDGSVRQYNLSDILARVR